MIGVVLYIFWVIIISTIVKDEANRQVECFKTVTPIFDTYFTIYGRSVNVSTKLLMYNLKE